MTLWKYSQQIPCTEKDLFKVLNKDPVISNKTGKWQLINKGLVAQSLSYGRLFVTPWTAARQDSLSFTIFWSLLKLMSIESVMPSNHLILFHPLLLLPSIFPNIRGFSNESVLHIRWPQYWSFSFSISPSSEYSRLISFRMDWLDLLGVQISYIESALCI